jgi:hypothetical protein
VTDKLPQPVDEHDLEWMITRFARLFLHDPVANLYRRKGERQHGVDVLAQDRRPGKQGDLWAFQSKYLGAANAALTPKVLEEELRKLADSPHVDAITHYILVTNTTKVTAARDAANLARAGRPRRVDVWGWHEFAREAREAGLWPWMPPSERHAARASYLAWLASKYEDADALDLPTASCARLKETWVEHAPSAPRDPRRAPRSMGTLHHLLTDAPDPLLLVTGEMGTGKTVGLLHAAWKEAQNQCLDRALPLILHASELLDAPSVDEAIKRHLRTRDAQHERLWTDPGTDWCVWVDGADEVGDRRLRNKLADLCRNLAGQVRVHKVAVTCRTPAPAGFLPEAAQVELGRWSQTEARSLFAKFGPTEAHTPPRLPSIPLLITLAGTHPGITATAKQIDQVLHDAFQEWHKLRDAASPAWGGSRPGLESLALTLLQGDHGAPGIDRALAAAFGLENAPAALQDAIERGVLRSTDGGAPTFVDPHVQTWLAACALARVPADEVLVEAFVAPRTREAVRYAVQRIRVNDRARGLRLVRALLAHRRLTLTETLARLDLGLDLLTDDLDDQVLNLVVLELSAAFEVEWRPWFTQELADRAQRLASMGGAAWDALWAALGARARSKESRAACLASMELSADQWLLHLRERDADVRAVAATKLAPWAGGEQVVDALLWTLHDEGSVSSLARPAFTAAASLRALEGPLRAALREEVHDLLHCGQSIAGAAAVALRPDEVDPATALRALRFAYAANQAPEIVRAVHALAARPEGERWLREHWPDGLHLTPRNDSPSAPTPCASLPPSSEVRTELIRALAPGLVRMGGEDAKLLWGNNDLIVQLCRVGETEPTVLIELIKAKPSRFIPPAGQAALGNMAVRDERVAAALLAAWQHTSPPSAYPGLALTPLIRDPRHHADAVLVFADWLQHYSFDNPLFRWEVPSLQPLLEVRPIFEAARARVVETWLHATGKHPTKEGNLHPITLGGVLNSAPATWWHDPTITHGLLTRADEGQGQWLDAAMLACEEAPLPDLLDIVERELRGEWSTPTMWAAVNVPRRLRYLRRHGRCSAGADIAEQILASHWTPGVMQATLLLAEVHGDLPRRAQVAAALWPDASLGDLDRPEALALVRSDLDLWCARACSVLNRGGASAASEVLALLRLAVDLPLEGEQLKQVRRALRWFGDLPLLWFRDPSRWTTVNATDQAELLLRDLPPPG